MLPRYSFCLLLAIFACSLLAVQAHDDEAETSVEEQLDTDDNKRINLSQLFANKPNDSEKRRPPPPIYVGYPGGYPGYPGGYYPGHPGGHPGYPWYPPPMTTTTPKPETTTTRRPPRPHPPHYPHYPPYPHRPPHYPPYPYPPPQYPPIPDPLPDGCYKVIPFGYVCIPKIP